MTLKMSTCCTSLPWKWLNAIAIVLTSANVLAKAYLYMKPRATNSLGLMSVRAVLLAHVQLLFLILRDAILCNLACWLLALAKGLGAILLYNTQQPLRRSHNPYLKEVHENGGDRLTTSSRLLLALYNVCAQPELATHNIRRHSVGAKGAQTPLEGWSTNTQLFVMCAGGAENNSPAH